MQGRLVATFVVTAVLLSAFRAGAHHSAAVAYDLSKTVTVQGVIAQVRWENPHTWVYVETKEPDGSTVKWGFEGKVPNLLIRSGITPSVLKPGLQVTVTGHPARDTTQKFGEMVEVTFADGKTIKP